MARKAKGKYYGRIRSDSGQHRRILAAMALFGVVLFVPVALRLYDLMVVKYDYYYALALRNQSRTTYVSARRGTIYDTNMNILACSVGVENVYLDPHELKQAQEDVAEISRVLGEILEKDPQWIAQQAADTTMRYKQIGANVDTETAAKIRAYINENDISGIHLEPGSQRCYPYETLAAQVIGFTNASGEGSEGIEAAYDAYLSGRAGKVITTKGNNEMDMPFSYENYIASNPGCDVVLTLDTVVQQCLENRLNEAIVKYDVQNGAFGMVMNVKTGAILAMATLGSYDPNQYLEVYDADAAAELEAMKAAYLALPEGSDAYTAAKNGYTQALREAQLKQWRNRCISDGYEPGSTFKVLTLSAALDSGAISLSSPFYCGGAERIPGRSQLWHCWRSAGHGAQTTAQALQNSCNLAFAHIALNLGGETFYSYIQNFGVLEKTGVDLAGESKGVFFSQEVITNTEKWGTASLTSASFGQTFKLTPIQLLRAISAVVNGGYLMEPYIVSEIIDADGNTVYAQQPTVTRQVISEETSAVMRSLLESVVTEGTAKNASVAGFSIGGKTGTSEKIDVLDENGQITLDKIVSFVGIAPMDDPEYIILVALDTPSRETGLYISGGQMAAPTAGAVLSDILTYLGVGKTEAPQTVIMPDLSGMTAKEASAALKELGLTMEKVGSETLISRQIPAAGQSVPVGSQVLVYLGEDPGEEKIKVPDFTGMTRQQASDAAGALGLYILVTGNPGLEKHITVRSQDIAAGTEVPAGTTIQLLFVDEGLR